MNQISIEEAFKKEGLDANNIKIEGVPARHVEALIATAKLWVGADHVDGDGELDYGNYDQSKYEIIYNMDESPSGSGFSLNGVVGWYSNSDVGARLSFKSREAAHYLFNQNKVLFKKAMTYNRQLINKK